MKERIPYVNELIEQVYKLGWSLGTDVGPTAEILTNPEKFSAMTDEQMDNFFENIYSEDGIISELESIRDPEGDYQPIIATIKSILEKDGNCWNVLFPQVFALLDRFWCYVSGMYFTEIAFTKFEKKLIESITTSKEVLSKEDFYKYILLKNSDMIKKLFKSTGTKNASNKYNRNTIMHGNYNPKNYEYKQFQQLVVLLSSLSAFCNELII